MHPSVEDCDGHQPQMCVPMSKVGWWSVARLGEVDMRARFLLTTYLPYK